MKRTIAFLALLASLAMLGPVSSAPADPAVDELIALNNKMQLATLHYDKDTVGALMTDDFEFVGDLGLRFKRKAFLDDLADRSYKFELNTPTETEVRHYVADCALVTGLLHIRATNAKKVIDVRLRYADIWVKRDGKWLWAFSQTAKLRDKKK